MTEYIERDAAVEIAEKFGTCNGSVLGRHSGVADCIASKIAGLPAADVAPVVRCKDCKYYKPEEVECGCDFAGGLPYVKSEDFCSYGERNDT